MALRDLTLLDPVHWSPCGEGVLKDVKELNHQGAAAASLVEEKGSSEPQTW